jgi:acyl-CoA reductase-like NAD-dependent aldehyde dehydrogenase
MRSPPQGRRDRGGDRAIEVASIPTPKSWSAPCPRPRWRSARGLRQSARLQAAADALRARRHPDRAAAIASRLDEIANLITAEAGLCLKDALRSRPRQRRAAVRRHRGAQGRRPDLQCDLTPHGKKRRVYTLRSPLLGVITAITPFNHPMNQVAHKVVPSIATNNRMVLKPSEKVPLGLLFADMLYEAGLPPEMLSVVTGDPREIADELITNPLRRPGDLHGRRGHRQVHRLQGRLPRVVLELGGNDPIIVMEDADIDEAATLAVQGSYKNSGQRCTAVKRMLVRRGGGR